MRLFVLLIALAAPPLSFAGEGLREGRYKVRVHLVLPHVDTSDYDFETEICWQGTDDPAMPLGPLGRGPLRECPSEARVSGDGVLVSTQCEGPNAGFAAAGYRATGAGFRGRVEMNMGGKNMTLAEEQRGTFLGVCE